MTPERLARLMATVTSEYAPPAGRQQALLRILYAMVLYPSAMENSVLRLMAEEEEVTS